jgi:hypothetical protein
MNCRSIKEFLAAYVDGELSSEQKDLVEEHLAGCLFCRAKVDGYRAVNQQIASLKDTATVAGIKGVTMSKIQRDNLKKPSRKWLRPALAAVPIVAIIIALTVLQPWVSFPGTSTVMAKTQAATLSIQSYRFNSSVLYDPKDTAFEAQFNAEYSSPDRYHVQMNENKDKTEELIVIGDRQYIKYADMSKNEITSTIAGFSSLLKPETTLRLLDTLTDIQTLPDENLNGVDSFHFKGRLDIEQQIAEEKRSLQEARDRTGADHPTDEEIDRSLATMRNENTLIELWISQTDYLVRQLKMERRNANNNVATSIGTFKFYDFNQPIAIEPPLDAQGKLLPDWQLAGSITSDSEEPVFISNIDSSIGAQPGYNDFAHQQISYNINIRNESSETVQKVGVTLSVMATNEEIKPAILEAQPEHPQHLDLAPDENETYHIVWNYDGTNQTKQEIVALLNQTIITVKFTTQGSTELTQILLSAVNP